MTPDEIARKSAEVMWANDVSSAHIGMVLKSVTPGEAVIEMPVADYMLNGQNVCHGGYVFTLADSCFAFACNSYNDATLAQGAAIDFVRPALPGDVLTAQAEEVNRGRRTGVFDVSVKNQHGKLIAVFRGKSFASGKPLFIET
ncbi:MAG: hydroxyphenylacetyl-CoA thioesterase PaaI [Gammaproteobacteria bacterium]